MNKFEIIDHTADIGLKVYGRDLRELFTNAAEGLIDTIVDINSLKLKEGKKHAVKINLKTSSLDELLVSWLRELLYQFSAHSFIFNKFEISNIGEKFISAVAKGQKPKITPELFKLEIKAVTYHDLSVKKEGGIWQAQVIFDV